MFEHNRQPCLVATVLAFVGFDSRALLLEVALWKLAGAELGKDAALGLGMPKARPELVMTAKAHAPGGVASPSFSVREQMGQSRRRSTSSAIGIGRGVSRRRNRNPSPKVNPDPRLRRVAKKRGWPIESW
jgi:hypothetical protein